MPAANPKNVFVVVGRNTAASDAMFAFLRAIGLTPIEWSEAVAETGSGSPYIGQVLDTGFEMAQAVVVLMTPDDVAQLRREYTNDNDDPELEPKGQARPNVLFEAGMAFGRHPDRTILVELGPLRPFTDVGGRHTVRLDNSPEKRNELASRLKTAGCDVVTTGASWYRAGDFTPPKAPGHRLGRGLSGRSVSRLDGKYSRQATGSGKLQITNVSGEDLFDLMPENATELRGRIIGFPVSRIPADKSVTLNVELSTGSPNAFDLIISGHDKNDDKFKESLFLNLNG